MNQHKYNKSQIAFINVNQQVVYGNKLNRFIISNIKFL